MTSHEQLDAAVKSAFEIRPNPKRLRIFSISTINIQPYLMNAADTKIAEVKLLLANAETYIQQPHRDFLEESKLTILWNWVTSVKSGKV